MQQRPQNLTAVRKDAMAWIAGRLIWDKRLAELRSRGLDPKVLAASTRAA